MSVHKKIHRNGVDFTCSRCGRLLRDCIEHNPADVGACPSCDGDLRKVGVGNNLVGNAVWYRCEHCGGYFMHRRGELVETHARNGFEEFA